MRFSFVSYFVFYCFMVSFQSFPPILYSLIFIILPSHYSCLSFSIFILHLYLFLSFFLLVLPSVINPSFLSSLLPPSGCLSFHFPQSEEHSLDSREDNDFPHVYVLLPPLPPHSTHLVISPDPYHSSHPTLIAVSPCPLLTLLLSPLCSSLSLSTSPPFLLPPPITPPLRFLDFPVLLPG